MFSYTATDLTMLYNYFCFSDILPPLNGMLSIDSHPGIGILV